MKGKGYSGKTESELIEREKTLDTLQEMWADARGEGAALVKSLVYAALKSRKAVPTVAGMTTEYEAEITHRSYGIAEDDENDEDDEELPFGGEDAFEETVPLDKIATFLAGLFKPPYWFKDGEVREWKGNGATSVEAWKTLLRTVAIDEEEL